MSEDEHEEGCLCGQHPLAKHEVTEDHDLPAARGGVQGDRKPRRRSDKVSVGEGD